MASAYAKTKTQFLYKHTNGQYYARGYVQGKSVWRSLKTDLYSAAVVRLKPALDEIRLQPKPGTESAAAVGDLIELYLAQVSRTVGIKPSTVHYRKQLFVRIRKEWPGVDDLVPRKVSARQAEEFAAALAKGLSPTRYNNSIDSLRAVFRIGIEEGLVSKNPFEKVGKLRPRAKQLKLPNTAAFFEILKIVRSKGAWCSRPVADLIEFLTYSGLRIYEAKMVKWSDIDFVRDTLTVTGGDLGTKNSVTGGDRGTENYSHRTLPLNDSLRRLLIDLRDNPRYFRNKARKNHVLAVSECEKALSRACKEAGTPRITHHDLRHLFATRCIESGIDIPTLSRWLGHKDGGALALKTYGHLCDDHSREMAGKLKF
jgi:integrase